MKIAFLLPSLANRGPNIVVKDIVKNIVDKVDEVTVFYFDDIVELDFECSVVKVKSIFSVIDFSKYDIVHSHCLRPDLYLKLISIFKNINRVSTVHNYILDGLSDTHNSIVAKAFSRIWYWVLSGKNHTVCLSKHAVDYYKSKINTKFHVVYNGRDFDDFGEVEQDDHEKIVKFKERFKVIGSSCLLTKRKGLEHVIKFLKNAPQYCFVVIGDGPEKDNLAKLALKLNVYDRCLFLGYRNGAVQYYKYFDFFAMPSRSEGFPLSLIEAASCKLPIICSNLPIFYEAFNGKEVAFFALDDDASFIEAMEKLDVGSSEFSKNVYLKYENNYTTKKMAEGYLKVYENVLSK